MATPPLAECGTKGNTPPQPDAWLLWHAALLLFMVDLSTVLRHYRLMDHNAMEQLLFDASVRLDRPPLQGSQLAAAAFCPASAAASAAIDASHQHHTRGSGPIWRLSWDTERGAAPQMSSNGELVNTRLSMTADGRAHQIDEEPSGPVLQSRVPYLWAYPLRLGRDSGRWRCPPGSTLCVAGATDDPGTIAFPSSFWELLVAATLARKWTGATGNVQITLHGPEDELTVNLDGAHLDVNQLRTSVARVESERQARARGDDLDWFAGEHCKRCDLNWKCDAYVGMLRAVALSLPSGKVSPIDSLHALDWLRSVTSRILAALHRHVDAKGPLIIGDRVWGKTEREEVSWPAADVARTLDLELGVNVSHEAVRIAAGSLREGLRKAVKKRVINESQAERGIAVVFERMKELKLERIKTRSSYGESRKEEGVR